jgi:RHS repeat-associated protein
VQKTVGSTITTYVYDGMGEVAVEYGASATVAGRQYLMADTLGSTRLVLDGSGNVQERIDYLPFGEEIAPGFRGRPSNYCAGMYPSSPDNQSQKFTGKERDAETGLDFFNARYMSSAQGRFTSPDRCNAMLIKQNMVAGGLPDAAATAFFNGFLENPQNWNQYAYVRNNPLRFTDPTGAAPAEGHHLIPERSGLGGLARDFANKIKTGKLSGNRWPNQPGFDKEHIAYNKAVGELLEAEEQVAGDANDWSLSKWKSFANEILNSDEPAIKEFLEKLEENNQGAKAALAAAISSYNVSVRIAATVLAEDLLNFLKGAGTTLIIMVDPAVANPQKKTQEVINGSHSNCLLDRSTGAGIQ